MSLIFVGQDCVHRRVVGDKVPAPPGSFMIEELPETLSIDIDRLKLIGGVVVVVDYTPEQQAAKDDKDLSDTILLKVGKTLFNHENRIRVLEGKAPITAAQFKTAITNL